MFTFVLRRLPRDQGCSLDDSICASSSTTLLLLPLPTLDFPHLSLGYEMGVLQTFQTSITSEGKSTRRPDALKDADYDHEIQLVDHAQADILSQSDSPTPSPHSRTPLKKQSGLRKKLAHRSLSKHRNLAAPNNEGGQNSKASTEPANTVTQLLAKPKSPIEAADEEHRGRSRSRSYGATQLRQKDQDGIPSDIDVLYENQRGCFMCGLPFFSGRALGNLDPAPWTNKHHKPSATGIEKAQVPDPSWTWAWKEWRLNRDGNVDNDGFEYSFSFSKLFSWHRPSWWNSFVRRRAWIRKRIKMHQERRVQESHMLNADYFTIHPPRNRSRASRTSSKTRRGKYSVMALAKQEMELELEKEDIEDIQQLLDVLRRCRIDREKMEAVENFIEHGGDDLYYLQETMHDIMSQFIFQGSRRTLLAHLLKIADEAIEHRKKHEETGEKEREEEKRRIDNLQGAITHAEEEVQRLEYWSDVKNVVENVETFSAVDDAKWGHEWVGAGNSGPKDVITDRDLSTESEKGKKQQQQRPGTRGAKSEEIGSK